MAASSLHLCHFSAQLQPMLFPKLVPNPSITNSLSSLHATNLSKFSKLSLKYVPVRRSPRIFNNMDISSGMSIPHAGKPEVPLSIGIIGFGNFGQFISKAFKRQGHSVLATSRSDYSEYCQQNDIHFFSHIEEMCEQQPDVILICSSILSTEMVVRGIPMEKLKPDTIFADVLSVKQFPRNLFLEVLPPEFGIVCTHPMFGPESGKNGLAKLPFVYDVVRIAENSEQEIKSQQFLSIFEEEGCKMVGMACEEHDHHAAGSQLTTHIIGRILSHLNLETTPINTKGYETLLKLTENTVKDSFDLFFGLYMYNFINASEQIENLERAFDTVKKMLFERLHELLEETARRDSSPITRDLLLRSKRRGESSPITRDLLLRSKR